MSSVDDVIGTLSDWIEADLRWAESRSEADRLTLAASWRPAPCHPNPLKWGWKPGDEVELPDRCVASAQNRDQRHDGGTYDYRGWCIGCGWIGPERLDHGENLAIEDALDHAWPGWREMPVIDVSADRARSRWDRLVSVYPDEWLQAGGPVREWRGPGAMGLRHHAHGPNANMAVSVEGPEALEAIRGGQISLFG